MDTPEQIASETQLDELLSRPTERLIGMMRRLDGDIMILGIGGKMGATVGRRAMRAVRRSGVERRVLGVSRFSNPAARSELDAAGVETIACDLLDPEAVADLPGVPNIIFMAGRKFGTDGSEPLTWAMNTIAPANVARRFGKSRIVAFSTGNVYPPVEPSTGGCSEAHPTGPVGEYAQSCLGRERIFHYFSLDSGTPLCLYRLNYACELRYGVIHDIGRNVWNGHPVDLSVGYVNIIWQGDASEISLLSLEHCQSPPEVINVTGPEILSVRSIAGAFAEIMDRRPVFTGAEGPWALLSDSGKAVRIFGEPSVSTQQMIRWNAGWIMAGGRSLGKPTNFQNADGRF